MTTEERVEKLEQELAAGKRRNRWPLTMDTALIAVGLLIAAGLLITLGMSFASPWRLGSGGLPKVIRAQALVLEDANGKPRAMLDVDKDGPELRLYDENGTTRALLAVVREGPVLALLDEKGKGRATAGTTQTTTPDGRTITYPESSLLLFGPDGKQIWSAP